MWNWFFFKSQDFLKEPEFKGFIVYVLSGNGYITTDVLREILSELDERMSEEELDEMIADIDSDGSGTVDFEGQYVIILRFVNV